MITVGLWYLWRAGGGRARFEQTAEKPYSTQETRNDSRRCVLMLSGIGNRDGQVQPELMGAGDQRG